MPVVTAIKPQRKKGYFNIFVDGRFALSLPEDLLVREKIRIGAEFSPKDLAGLTEESFCAKLLNRALLILSRRPHSLAEIRQKLRRQAWVQEGGEFPRRLERVIGQLQDYHLVDDEAFARWLFEQRTKGKSARGLNLIRRELRGKGVSPEIFSKIVDERQPTDWRALAVALIKPRWERLRSLPPAKKRQRLFNLLVRRGYDFETARSVVDEFLKDG